MIFKKENKKMFYPGSTVLNGFVQKKHNYCPKNVYSITWVTLFNLKKSEFVEKSLLKIKDLPNI